MAFIVLVSNHPNNGRIIKDDESKISGCKGTKIIRTKQYFHLKSVNCPSKIATFRKIHYLCSMSNKNITRREALERMGLSLLGLSLLGLVPTGCIERGRHPDQKILRNRCDGCGKCSCPYGVDIAANLTLYNQEAEAGRLPDPREGLSDSYKKESARFIRKVNKIPRLAQADRCISCMRCAGSCPQNVKISQALHQMEALIEKVKEDGTLA